jgi:hypothetical protein
MRGFHWISPLCFTPLVRRHSSKLLFSLPTVTSCKVVLFSSCSPPKHKCQRSSSVDCPINQVTAIAVGHAVRSELVHQRRKPNLKSPLSEFPSSRLEHPRRAVEGARARDRVA